MWCRCLILLSLPPSNTVRPSMDSDRYDLTNIFRKTWTLNLLNLILNLHNLHWQFWYLIQSISTILLVVSLWRTVLFQYWNKKDFWKAWFVINIYSILNGLATNRHFHPVVLSMNRFLTEFWRRCDYYILLCVVVMIQRRGDCDRSWLGLHPRRTETIQRYNVSTGYSLVIRFNIV